MQVEVVDAKGTVKEVAKNISPSIFLLRESVIASLTLKEAMFMYIYMFMFLYTRLCCWVKEKAQPCQESTSWQIKIQRKRYIYRMAVLVEEETIFKYTSGIPILITGAVISQEEKVISS